MLKSLDYRIRSGSGKELFIHQELTVITPGTLLGTVQDITRQQASLRSRERFWDIRVPKIDSIFDNSLVPRSS